MISLSLKGRNGLGAVARSLALRKCRWCSSFPGRGGDPSGFDVAVRKIHLRYLYSIGPSARCFQRLDIGVSLLQNVPAQRPRASDVDSRMAFPSGSLQPLVRVFGGCGLWAAWLRLSAVPLGLSARKWIALVRVSSVGLFYTNYVIHPHRRLVSCASLGAILNNIA